MTMTITVKVTTTMLGILLASASVQTASAFTTTSVTKFSSRLNELSVFDKSQCLSTKFKMTMNGNDDYDDEIELMTGNVDNDDGDNFDLDDGESLSFVAMDVMAIDEEEEKVSKIVVATKDVKVHKPTEQSWSELLSEAAGAAILLGGKAAKIAAEKVGELKTEMSPVSMPTSLQDVATQAASLREVATKIVSTATEAAAGAIKSGAVGTAGLKRSNADVSIPYDSAARLAYDEWLTTYQNKIKRPADDDDDWEGPSYTAKDRFQFFQERYINATVQNVTLKKQLRNGPTPVEDINVTESGTPAFVMLDQYADLSPDEYTAVMMSLEPKSWVDILGEIAALAGTAAASAASTVEKMSPKVKDESKGTIRTTSKKSSPTSSFSIFSPGRGGPQGSTAATSLKTKKTTITSRANGQPTSIFGSLLTPKTVSGTPKTKTTVKAANKSPKARKAKEISRISLSLFGSKQKEVASDQATTPTPTRSTFSIFGSRKTATAAKGTTKGTANQVTSVPNIPTLSNWVQNADGSLTGKVRNSKSYRNGTKITTSPVRRGVKKGSVVKTGSGSQYKLM